MFNDLVISGANSTKTNKSWTVLVSTIIQAAILGVLILIPLIYTEALPKGMLATFIVPPPPPPPPPPPAAAIQRIVKPVVHLIKNGQMMAPTVIPKKIEMIKEEAAPPDVGGAPPPPPPPKAHGPVRVGGQVQAANLLRMVQPVYPPIAKTAHISGTVVLHAIISKEGVIEKLEYVSGPPLLMKNAMDAVNQWRYRPTLLNGEPVEVDTTVSVVFTLGG